jgi:lipopolysaccharide export LptBFGC system permease protein LptF
MMKTLLVILFSALTICGNSQEFLTYIDSNNCDSSLTGIPNRYTDSYFEILNGDTINQFIISWEFVNSNRQDEIKSISRKMVPLRDGKWVFFRKNGYVKKQGFYTLGIRTGKWVYYDRKNQVKKVKVF